MGKIEKFAIVGSVAAGAVVAGALFLLYPDLMFGNSSFSTQSSGSAPSYQDGAPTTITSTDPSLTNNSADNSTTYVPP